MRQHQLRWAILIGVCMAAFVAWAPISASAAETGFLDRVYQDEAGDHKYTVFVPADYTPDKKWPVILYLHSAGQRGNDGKAQTALGLGPSIRDRAKTFGFITVFPQAEDTKGRILTAWSPDSSDGARALKILETVEKNYNVDTQHRILTGWSMGGYGVWLMAAAHPDMWSALVPVSGGGDPAIAPQVNHLPIWAFHGAADPIVKVDESRKLIDALKAAGAKPLYTEYSGVEHNAWKNAYSDARLYKWMLDPTATVDSSAPLLAKPRVRNGVKQAAAEETPFIPALEIPNAISVRLGNNMLAALADTIPQVLPADTVRGRIANIGSGTTAEGLYFSVTMYGISYSGTVVRSRIAAYRKDRVNIQVGLRNVQISISGASVSGPSGPFGGARRASAGPMSIVLGHQRPIWISFDVTPYITDRQLKLKLAGTNFRIPQDNWYVSGPNGVSATGLGMDEGRVASGLRSGLYGSRARIEREIQAAIPPMIEQLEKHIDLSPAGKLVAGLWPLPVYKPRVRVWPQSVSTDERGISIVLGATAAAIDPRSAPASPKVIAPIGPDAAAVPQSVDFQFGLAPQILGPLTQMMVDEDVARIHLLDTPVENFKSLANPSLLAEVIPDLRRYGDNVEVWSELIMTEPLSITDVSAQASEGDETQTSSRVQLQMPRLLISLAIKPDPSAEQWMPYAEFEFSARQEVVPELKQPTSLTRALQLAWQGEPQIDLRARFAPDYQPQIDEIQIDRVREILLSGWAELTRDGTASQVDIADIDLGYSRLRAGQIEWAAPQILATFVPPGVRITNSFDQPLVYETQGPYSGWGGPYTLPPGESHFFNITHPLIYRRRIDGTYKKFTLPVGTHSEYRAPIAGTPPQLYQARENIPKQEAAQESETKEESEQ